jgi:hypothetical protein
MSQGSSNSKYDKTGEGIDCYYNVKSFQDKILRSCKEKRKSENLRDHAPIENIAQQNVIRSRFRKAESHSS